MSDGVREEQTYYAPGMDTGMTPGSVVFIGISGEFSEDVGAFTYSNISGLGGLGVGGVQGALRSDVGYGAYSNIPIYVGGNPWHFKASNLADTKAAIFGWDETNSVGVMGALEHGVAWKNFVINPNGGYLGIGIIPGELIHTSSSAFNILRMDLASATDSPSLLGKRARGSVGGETAVKADDILYSMNGRGFGATAYSSSSRTKVVHSAAEDWNDSVQGTYLGFHTTAIGGATTTEKLRLDGNGNLGLGATSFGSSAVNVFAIKGSTAPGSSPADTIQIFAVDIAGSHEARVRDEGGTVTTFSPHNFTLFEPSEEYTFPWSYYSRNEYIGKEINVDMFGLAREIENLTGKKFIFENDIPKRDWDEDQAINISEREAQIEMALSRVKALQEKCDDCDNEEKIFEMIMEIQEIKIPEPLTVKAPPKWIADRIKKNSGRVIP